ncbi:MAG: thioredoxin family protein [Anaerolineales bacterium]|jgi:small redox-active disulfide protein 2
MVTIKVLGSGCANCQKVEKISKKVIEMLAIEGEVVKVTNHNDILSYGVMHTPGLVINENLVCSGRIPSEGEVTSWVTTALDA